jgi:hypothetical protein
MLPQGRPQRKKSDCPSKIPETMKAFSTMTDWLSYLFRWRKPYLHELSNNASSNNSLRSNRVAVSPESIKPHPSTSTPTYDYSSPSSALQSSNFPTPDYTFAMYHPDHPKATAVLRAFPPQDVIDDLVPRLPTVKFGMGSVLASLPHPRRGHYVRSLCSLSARFHLRISMLMLMLTARLILDG